MKPKYIVYGQVKSEDVFRFFYEGKKAEDFIDSFDLKKGDWLDLDSIITDEELEDLNED